MAADTGDEEFERRAGTNQALFREANERVNESNNNTLWLDCMCECADEACVEQIELTPDEYERVRKNPTQFAVVASPEHVVPDVERVVERHERYWVVEKVGEAGAVVIDLDARRPRGGMPI